MELFWKLALMLASRILRTSSCTSSCRRRHPASGLVFERVRVQAIEFRLGLRHGRFEHTFAILRLAVFHLHALPMLACVFSICA